MEEIEVEKDDLFRGFELAVLNLWFFKRNGRAYSDEKVLKLYDLVSQVPEEWSCLTHCYFDMLREIWDLDKALDNEKIDLFDDLTFDDFNYIRNQILGNIKPLYKKSRVGILSNGETFWREKV